MKKFLTVLLILTLAIMLAVPALAGDKVVVASKIDTEGALLGNMILLMLEENGIATENRTEFGPTPMVRKAITSGQIDIYPEYTGNGAFFFNLADSPVWKDAEKGYWKVRELDKEKNDIVWLTPAPANNTWAIAVRKDLAKKEKLFSLEDLARYVNSGGRIKLAGSEEFVNSAAALPAFQKAYGFKLRKDQLLTLSGGNTAQTEKAAATGVDGVNFAMAYGTDGQLAALGLLVLEDTKGVQPVYEPAPIIRMEVLNKYPEIEKILKPVFESLDIMTLQTLNARIQVEGLDARAVAAKYLKTRGFLK
ncbi:MAG TPA: ABC transporter substrate-binding protein [Proteobacteria bacterium]|nr:putative osmoprotectant uptake system substrate-binding protein OsmF precursor [bacterium BMS3Abin14]HDL54013.1 ABC transporter substrate-binding protein [Pseudomonadota bacterium]